MRRTLLALVILAGGATARAESPGLPPSKPVDLLIVVDTAPDASAVRAALATAMPAFVQDLDAAFPGDYANAGIDLHAGVITADLADQGHLRTAAVADCAAAPSDAYVIAHVDQYGARDVNFAGALPDAIRCLLPAPSAQGPAVAQPLATMIDALDAGASTGFRRPGATLAVLVVTGQDDCSAAGGDAPLDRFACAQAGWSCTPSLDATAGPRTCAARADAPGLYAIDQTITALQGFAPPDLIAVGVYRGPASPIVVAAGPSIASSCASGSAHATPALRLDALADAALHGWHGDACGADGLAGLASTIAAASFPPGLNDDYRGDCDGGGFYGDNDAGRIPVDHVAFGCGGCASGGPGSGGALLVLLALTRSFPSRRCRARRARAAG